MQFHNERPVAFANNVWKQTAIIVARWANRRVAYTTPLQVANEVMRYLEDGNEHRSIVPKIDKFFELTHSTRFLLMREHYADIIDDFAKTVLLPGLRGKEGNSLNLFYLDLGHSNTKLPYPDVDELSAQWDRLWEKHREIAQTMADISGWFVCPGVPPESPAKKWKSGLLNPGGPTIRELAAN